MVGWIGRLQEWRDVIMFKFLFGIYDWALWLDEKFKIFGLSR